MNGCFQACFTCQNIASTSPLICYNVAPVLILHGDSSSIPACICRVVINKLPFVCVATISSEPSAFKDAVIVLLRGPTRRCKVRPGIRGCQCILMRYVSLVGLSGGRHHSSFCSPAVSYQLWQPALTSLNLPVARC